jgi:two-component system chemotaxis response regulator CheB
VGVVLSGTRDDGTAGLAAIAARGGAALVQDPEDALYATMPLSALEHVPGARSLPAAKLGAEIAELLADPDRGLRPPGAPDPLLTAEHRIAAAAPDAPTTDRLGAAVPSGLSCPDCDGGLFELPGRPAPRYRCRVGHAWGAESLTAAHDDGVDTALWVALAGAGGEGVAAAPPGGGRRRARPPAVRPAPPRAVGGRGARRRHAAPGAAGRRPDRGRPDRDRATGGGLD